MNSLVIMPDQAFCPGFGTASKQGADGCNPSVLEKQTH